jgi:hypothetical protein
MVLFSYVAQVDYCGSTPSQLVNTTAKERVMVVKNSNNILSPCTIAGGQSTTQNSIKQKTISTAKFNVGGQFFKPPPKHLLIIPIHPLKLEQLIWIQSKQLSDWQKKYALLYKK